MLYHVLFDSQLVREKFFSDDPYHDDEPGKEPVSVQLFDETYPKGEDCRKFCLDVIEMMKKHLQFIMIYKEDENWFTIEATGSTSDKILDFLDEWCFMHHQAIGAHDSYQRDDDLLKEYLESGEVGGIKIFSRRKIRKGSIGSDEIVFDF